MTVFAFGTQLFLHTCPASITTLAAIILPLLGTNLSEWLKIQKRETPSSGPSFTNSCPSPLPHLPQRTCNCYVHSYYHPVWPVLFLYFQSPSSRWFIGSRRTLKAVRVSIILVTLSSLMVSVKAGQGDEWANLERLENSGWLHWEHTYIPAGGSWF